MHGRLDKKFSGWVGDIAIILTSSRLQVTLRVETCVELELSLSESDLEPSLLIVEFSSHSLKSKSTPWFIYLLCSPV